VCQKSKAIDSGFVPFFDSVILRQRPMSKQPASKTNLKPRVSGGVPWWILAIMAVLGAGIVFALVQRSIPEDPAQLFQQALVAADKQDANTIRSITEKLSAYPEFANKKKLLDGILQLGSSRPLKAIVLLKEASEEKEIREKSLMLLGTAYAQSENLQKSVETFETVLKENNDSNDARFRLANVYKELLALDLSLSHLGTLIAAEYKLPETCRMRGDILFDRRQFAEAANDYEAAIRADKNNPVNSMIADRLVQSLLKISDLKRAEDYLALLDQSPAKGFFEAEKILQSGDLSKLGVVVESLRKNAAFDPRSHVLYGRLKLKEDTAQKAAEGIAGLRASLQFLTRNEELFQVVRDLAKLAGDEGLSVAAQQNIDQLQALDKEFLDQLTAVSKTQDGYEERLKLAQLSRDIGQLDFATQVYQSLTNAYPDKASEIAALKEQLYSVSPPLVALPLPPEQETAAPAEAATEAKAATTPPPAATSEPEATPEPVPTPDAASNPDAAKNESAPPASESASPTEAK
jgi:tetratricopeptide (TPR) repeat protein